MSTNVMDCLQDSFDPPITLNAIDRVERALGVHLPADYCNFLLQYNGGYFGHVVQFTLPDPKGPVGGGIMNSMFGIFDDVNYSCDQILDEAEVFEGRIASNMLPIGSTGENILCLCISDDAFGSIFLWDSDMEDEEDEQQLHFVAPNISAFLDMLWIDPDFVSHEETIPIFQAVETGDLAAVKRFLSHGVDVNSRNELGQTLLICSARNSWPKIAVLLLSGGASVNASDKTSCDALYYAAVSGSVDIAKLLLAAGAEVNTSNDARQSAIEAATEAIAFRVVDLLVAAAKTE
jgi:hypothetical protein